MSFQSSLQHLPASDVRATRLPGSALKLGLGLAALLLTIAYLPTALWLDQAREALASFSEARPVLRPGFSSVVASPAPARLLLDLGWLPGIELRTVLVALHLVGLCFGLGGATMLDFWILRWLRWKALPETIIRTFEFLAKVVTVGLILLWLSGLGFLLTYAVDTPEKLANPKILAKVTMVLALTLNGLILHARVIPKVLAHPQRPLLLDLTLGERVLFILCGAVSGVSWYAAFALGLLKEFNNKVPATELLGLWLLAIAAVASLTALMCWMAIRRAPEAAAGLQAS